MNSDADVIELLTLLFPEKFVPGEADDIAAGLRWANIDEIDKAARKWRAESHYKPKLPNLRKLINDARGEQPRALPPEKSQAEVLGIEMKISPAAAAFKYWRDQWARYAADAVQREANLPTDGAGRDIWEKQFEGMERKCKSSCNAALVSLGGELRACQSIADQITATDKKFDRTFDWLCSNELPRASASDAPAKQVTRAIFGENLFRSVPALVNQNELDRQRQALAASTATQPTDPEISP